MGHDSGKREMKQKYEDWIEKNILDTADGLCLEWSGLMTQIFPELALTQGTIFFKDGTFEGHFWCVDSRSGDIIDPTACQYGEPIQRYEFKKHPRPTGKCKVCGEKTYLGYQCCSVPCYSVAETENRL